MIRRKKSASGRSSRRKRGESSSPARRRGSDVCHPPPEFSPYDYEQHALYLLKSIKGQHYPFLSNGFIHLLHELEAIVASNQFIKEYMAGEMQFMNDGFYPTPDLNSRLMPVYDSMTEERTPTPQDNSETHSSGCTSSGHVEDEPKETEICLLPDEREEDDLSTYPAPHVGTRFWKWCRHSFMGDIDTEYLESFKEVILDAYSEEVLQKYFVNEPWKYRKRAPPPPISSRRKSLNSSSSKSSRKVSHPTEVISPTNSMRNANKKSSLAGYRIPNRRNSEKEKDSTNNNRIMPMIGSMVYSACREARDSKPIPESPTTRRGKFRMTSREHSKERERKYAKIKLESDSDEEMETYNGLNQRGTTRLQSPRQVKKEKFDDEYEKHENGHSSTNGINGHSHGPVSPKRKNGDIRNYFSAASKSSLVNGKRKTIDYDEDEIEMPSDIEDFDAKAIGSRIVSKLIAGGILPESSAHIFEQMTLEDNEDATGVSAKVEMSEEGKDDAEDQEVGELAEELQSLQMSLREEMTAKKALFMLTWRRAKAHFAFFHTFSELKRADYDLFRLGVNIYKDFPRKLPGYAETPVLKDSLRKRNHLARMHYSKLYRRHPKYRWHRGHLSAGRRTVL